MKSTKSPFLVGVLVCLVATTVTAYPQKQSPLARLFPSNRQASLDDFNYLQHGTSISNPQNRPSAPAAPTTTNRPCIPVQYRRSHPNGIAADDSIDTKITFYLANPTNRPYPYRPAANVAASGAAAAYNSYSGYHCDQTVSYRPFWLDIANLFGIFGAANGQQPESTPTNGIRPVHEDGESSNANSNAWPSGSGIVGAIPNTVNGYYQSTQKRPQYAARQRPPSN